MHVPLRHVRPRAMTDAETPQSLHDLGAGRLREVLLADGVAGHHTKALWRALYREPEPASLEDAGFLGPLQRWVARRVGEGRRFFLDAPVAEHEVLSSDGLTRKWVLRLRDGRLIETVLMRYDGRHTACISTQVGCAMGCVFCATGQMGFRRHLRPGEIIAQVLLARRALRRAFPQHRLRNLVLMGMGEPLHNYHAVMAALETICDVAGIGIAPSKTSISTVGVVPGILRLAAEPRPFRLAVSLHGASQEERQALVPVARQWPLAELLDACRHYCATTGRRIFFEWTLVAGCNDTPETARRLIGLLRGLDAHVNLIPLNPTGGYAGQASRAGLRFHQLLREAGIPATLRQRRGIDVAAGCGQLAGA